MKRIATCVLVGGLFSAATARADVIATVQFPFRISSLYETPPINFTNEITYSVAGFAGPVDRFSTLTWPIPNEVGDGFRFTPADVGSTHTITATDDPQFANFAALAGGGDANLFFIATTYGSNSRFQDFHQQSIHFSWLFNTQPDFASYQLTSIDLRLDKLIITDNVAPDPTRPTSLARQYDSLATLTFQGTPVPEPTAAGILAVIAGSFLRRRHRDRGSPR